MPGDRLTSALRDGIERASPAAMRVLVELAFPVI
jgi:hypothetical protein